VSGLAGGLIETSCEVGGAIGVAVVATLAISRVDDVIARGGVPVTALTEGYQRASLATALITFAAAGAAALLLRRAERPTSPQPAADPHEPAVAPELVGTHR